MQTVTMTSESGIFEQKVVMLTAVLDLYLRVIINIILYYHPTQFKAKEMVS